MKIGEYLLAEWGMESASTRRMLESVPEEKFQWKPHEKSRTLGELAQHVAALPSRFLPIFETDSFDPTEHRQPALTGKADMLELFDEGSTGLAERLGSTPESEYDRQWSFGIGGRVISAAPKAMALRRMLFDHMIHHRAQLSVYLRMLDVPVPGMYGPSADER